MGSRIAEAADYMLGGMYEPWLARRDDGSLYAADFGSMPQVKEWDRMTVRCARVLWNVEMRLMDPDLMADLLDEAPRDVFRRFMGAMWIASGFLTRDMVERMTMLELASAGLEVERDA